MPAVAQTIDGGATVTVPGSQSSPWNIPGALSVGNLSTGTLIISTGGIVSSGSGFVGRQVSGIGTVTVTGAGAQWTTGPGLSVGNFGNGTLNITNGGLVSSTTNSNIGVALGSTGKATVSGVGSQWTSVGFLRVGVTGNGTLDITDGGVVSNGIGAVGFDNTGTGAVTVNGAGSQWNNSAGLTVGSFGIGRLSITNGGVVSSTTGTIGAAAPSAGTVTVDGAGSAWTNSSTLTVGNSGTGSLTISNNGTVSAVSASVAALSGSQGVINIGAAATDPAAAPGTLTLTGAAPALTLGAAGSLVFNHTSGSYQFALGVTGAGKVDAHSGTTILTGTNTYSGGTTINPAATLQLGNGGTTGSIVGNVTNNGALTFNRSDTVTFAGVISGTGAVNHNGTGTTILTANNTYTGVTTISAGTLQLGNGGASGSIVGDVFNNAALAFNRSDVFTYSGSISGTGAVSQIGNGTTIFTSTNNSYSGPTNINAGVLQAGAANTFSPNSVANVAGAGTLDLNGFSQTVAGVTNAGLINMGTGTLPGTTLTTPNYIGQGGTIAMNTFLGTDGSPSDKLIINGGAATGSSFLRVTNVGGAGALTTGNGILLVDTVNGGTTVAGAFALANAGGYVAAGPYAYTLFRSSVDASNEQGWYLRSTLDCALDPTHPACSGPTPPTPPPNFRPETSLYAAIPSMALLYGRTLLDTLHERVGDEEDLRNRQRVNGPASGAWARVIAQHGNQNGDPLGVFGSGPKFNYNVGAFQGGQDLLRHERADGSRDHLGLYGAVGLIRGDVTHVDRTGAGTDSLNAYSLGGYWTHFGATGWYLDTLMQGTWYDTKGLSGRLPTLTTNGWGLAGSVEAGYPIKLGGGFIVEPQAQIVYQVIRLDDGSDTAATVQFRNADSFALRVGARVARTWSLGDSTNPRLITAWIRPSFWNEFLGRSQTLFSSATGPIPFQSDIGGGWFEFNAGVNAVIDRETSLFASAGYQIATNGNSDAYNGKLGLRLAW